MGPVRRSFELTHLPKEALLAATAAVVLLTFRSRRFDFLDATLLAFAASTTLSAAAALSPAFAWRPALLTLSTVVIALALRDREDRGRWLRWLAAALLVLATLGLIETLGLAHWSLEGRAPSSLLGQRNTLAHVLVLGLVVFFELAEERRAWWFGAALLTLVIVMTRSRAAWLAVPVVLLAARRPKAVLAVAAGALLGSLLPAQPWRSAQPYADSLRRLFDATHGSGAGRLEQWQGALASFSTHPLFGVGPGNGFLTLAREPNRFLNSDAVAMLVERGLLGAALALLIAAQLLRPRTAALAAVAVTGALDSVTQLPAAALLFTVLAFHGLSRTPEQPAPTGTAKPLAAFFALASVLCGLAFASRVLSTGDNQAFEVLTRAVQLDPTDAFTRLELVRAQVSAGRCDDAKPHVPVLEHQLPGRRDAREVVEAYESFCGGRSVGE